MAKERLQRILAAAGIESRRKCEELILQGVVKVNGKRIESLPAFADPERDNILVKGKPIKAVRKAYYLLNKPKGTVCTVSDPKGRPKAMDLVPAKERVFFVGGMDAESSGLILVTNDTELSNRLTKSKYELPKTFVARVKGPVAPEDMEKLKKGVWLSEGKAVAQSARIVKTDKLETSVEVTMATNLSRQVHRMLAKFGYKVKSINRTQIGTLTSKGLVAGQCRILSKNEIEYLKKSAGLDQDEAQ